MTPRPSGGPALTNGLLAVLAVLATVGPFATDMYLASFTEIADSLSVHPSSVQLTLTAFLLGMGAGQLVFGSLSDRVGRRPVLIVALCVFAVSSIAMVFSPNITVFVLLRGVQGFTGSAGVVLARAIAVDLTSGTASVRALSLIATLVGLGPLIAPPLGGIVGEQWGWRIVLAVLAAIATTMLVLAWRFVPESLPRSARSNGGIGRAFAGYGTLLSHPRFAPFIGAFALAFAALMAYISASPFVAQTVLSMSQVEYSLAFSFSAMSLILANLLNARVASSIGPARMLGVGATLLLLATTAFSVFTLTGTLTPVTFIGCAFVLSGGAGLTMSNTSALALAQAGSIRGTASALLGAAQFLFGGIASVVVGLWGEHTALPMALVTLAAGLGALVFVVIAVRR